MDETGMVKKGEKSIGANWQYYGNVDKYTNSQWIV
jgi:SRSO17 transposase